MSSPAVFLEDVMPCDRCGIEIDVLIPCDHAELCPACRSEYGCRYCRFDARLGI